MPSANGRLLGLIRWMRTLFIYALILVLTSFVANLWLTRNQAEGTAPLLQGQQLDGNWVKINYSDYAKPLVLYFFADWCPICRFQHPVISSVAQDYPVIAIAMQSGDHQQVRQYLEQQGLALQVINDVDSSISSSFGVQGVPATFIIRNDHTIAFSTRGYVSEPGLLSRIWLAQ